jgi:acetylglutamate/LysW-gamma-L-alpha-aminoadipate kinase
MSLRSLDIQPYEARVSGGMRRKLIGAREALQAGVRRVVLADARAEHPVLAALAGRGTVIV